MANTIVVGSQWGDEGKAKVIDYLTERSDIIIRYQGGANAGHTVIVDGDKFVFHMVPSGIMYPDKVCLVGNGVVFDAEQFLREVDELVEKGISVTDRLFVSDHAHLVLPYHKALDRANETAKAGKKIGTTGRGIGPAYQDKVARTGIRTGTLLDWDQFTRQLAVEYERKKAFIEQVLKQECTLSLDTITRQFKEIRDRIKPFLIDTTEYIFQATRSGKRLLFEGAQGAFLDIDHGTYPYVTSSNTVAGAACTGAGIGPTLIDETIGIVKMYTTRVGNGPFPTELTDETGQKLQQEGGEFGATTGRPRRCGWFDCVLVRKAIQMNSLTRLALTKLDVLNTLDEIKICTHYRIHDTLTDTFPSCISDLDAVEPVYETLPGWKQDLGACTRFEDLPENARAYIQRIQQLCYEVPILIVSIGPDRKQTIEVKPVS